MTTGGQRRPRAAWVEPAALEWPGVLKGTAQTVRELRGLLGWSQETLARQARLSQGAISRFETGLLEGVPLLTAVKLLTTLAAGAQAVALPLSPAARELLSFGALFAHPVVLTGPLEADLVQLIHAFHQLPEEPRKAVLRLIESATDLFGRAWEWTAHDAGRGGTVP